MFENRNVNKTESIRNWRFLFLKLFKKENIRKTELRKELPIFKKLGLIKLLVKFAFKIETIKKR
jgi:hypothetical protein